MSNSSVIVPREISVGFQKRTDTFSGKLAYVVFTDEKGVLRKENSWKGWQDKSIPPLVADNVPTSGFVLNRRAGGTSYGWNPRQSYVRVYDPRGFEVELTVPGLLYILENVDCIKGKGLNGEFVYGWDGTELLLIPTTAPDYTDMVAKRDAIYDGNTIKAKDLVLGGTYKNRKGERLIYMGRFPVWRQHYEGPSYKQVWQTKGKGYFFRYQQHEFFCSLSSLGNSIVSCVDDTPVGNYAELMDKLESDRSYSPPDNAKARYVSYTLDEFTKTLSKKGFYQLAFYSKGNVYRVQPDYNRNGEFIVYNNVGYSNTNQNFGCIEDIFNRYAPQHKEIHLANGRFYQQEC